MSRRPWGEDPQRRELSATLRRIAPGAHVIRLRPDGAVTAYRADRTILRGRNRAQDERIGQLLRGYFQGVDWQVGHDYYLRDAALRTAPLPGLRGSQPAADGAFGSALSPTYLPNDRTAVLGGPS